MALDFPNSPTVGQTFSSGGTMWAWDGVKWNGATTAPTTFVQKAGDTMTGALYVPTAAVGTSTTQVATTAFVDAESVAKAGDTMTGDLTITKAAPNLILNKTSTVSNVQVVGQNSGIVRWNVILGNNTAESGGNAGSDFGIYRYTDGGSQNGGSVLNIARSTGQVTLGQPLNLPSTGTFTANQAARVAEIGALNCGRLAYVSATALQFKPFSGDRIKVNGVIWPIPNAGIAGLANTGVYVDGVAGQNLAANTTYLVFVHDYGGGLTADFRSASAWQHSTSVTAGNAGVEVISQGATLVDGWTLIGLIRTNASAQFVDTPSLRFVRSWFNRQRVTLDGGFISSFSTTSTSFASAGGGVSFICFAGEVAALAASGYIQNNTVGNSNYMQIFLDGAGLNGWILGICSTASYPLPASVTAVASPSEALHTCDVRVQAGGGTLTCGFELVGWLG